MKNLKLPLTPAAFIKANKIEIYESLSEKFGTDYGLQERNSEDLDKMNFQLDRLFTIMHHN